MPLSVTSSRLLRAASAYYRIRRRFYHRTATKNEIAARRTRFYRDVWNEAAAACDGEVRQVAERILEITCGPVVLRTRTNLTSLDDPLTVGLTENKPLVYSLLAQRGLPVPRHHVVTADDLPAAWAFARALGSPCVVKPARGTSGAIGITTRVDNRREMARALAYTGAFGREVLVEEQVDGGVYRLLYLDGELLDAVLRLPPALRADGVRTIDELIAAENERRLRVGIEAAQSLIKIDRELRRTLAAQHRSLKSVPPAGELLRVKNIVNDNSRDENLPALVGLSQELVAAGSAAAAAVGTRFAGVDLITPDPAVSLADAGGVVLEVNAAPGLYYHYMKRGGRTAAATLVLQRLLSSSR